MLSCHLAPLLTENIYRVFYIYVCLFEHFEISILLFLVHIYVRQNRQNAFRYIQEHKGCSISLFLKWISGKLRSKILKNSFYYVHLHYSLHKNEHVRYFSTIWHSFTVMLSLRFKILRRVCKNSFSGKLVSSVPIVRLDLGVLLKIKRRYFSTDLMNKYYVEFLPVAASETCECQKKSQGWICKVRFTFEANPCKAFGKSVTSLMLVSSVVF